MIVMFSNVGAANVITSKQAVCHIIGEHFIMLLVQGTGFYFGGKNIYSKISGVDTEGYIIIRRLSLPFFDNSQHTK